MTHPPDPALASSFGEWAFWVFMFVLSFWRRRKQNEKTVAEFKAASAEEVAALTTIVNELKSSQEHSQTRYAAMTEKINHLDGTLVEVKSQIAEFHKALPETTDILSKVLNVLERLKAGTLVDKQEVKGNVAFKEEKKKS